ncbi:cytidine deaminase [Violaceomyces palustris]|uniref:Cytidine deaminase n=1 Tax=Violaceomyces palustris TaxID=1673888 RepID=A0ACD0P2F4_9BASI|nr:cytidine deaminase [Violaceomyces palustris]
MELKHLQLISNKKAELLTAAQQARNLSYSPYSKFRVGASLLTKSGVIIQGANIENSSYGATVCAERTAFGKALMESHSSGDFIAVAVASDLEGPCSPCGICRQVIREFCPLDVRVLMVGSGWKVGREVAEQPELEDLGGKELEEEHVTCVTLQHLLPMSFGPDDLEKPRQS